MKPGPIRADLSARLTGALLVVVVAGSALWRGLSARDVKSPWIVPDELIYSSLARSFASTGHFAIRGVDTLAYSLVYPLTLAGPLAIHNPVSGYEAAKWTNAVVMSLAAFPVYFLARRLLPRWLAVVSAAFALLVPSMAYTGVLMTENAAYPLFLLAMLAIVRVLERPTTGRQLAVLLAIAVAYATRAQAIVFVPALLIAIVLVGVSETNPGGVRRELRGFAPLLRVLAGVGVVIAAAEVVRGSSPAAFLGTYSSAVQSYPLSHIPRWVAAQLADLELYLGFFPLVPAMMAAWALLARPAVDRQRRALAAMAAGTGLCTVLLVAVFSAGPGEQAEKSATYPALGRMLHERYLFYLAPLFLILFFYWLHARREFSNKRLAPLLVLAIALPLALPYEHVLTNADFEALALLPWNNALIAGRNVPYALAVTAAILLPLLFVRRGTILLLQVGFAALFLWLVGLVATHEIRDAAVQFPSSRFAAPAWVDAAVPNGDRVAVVWRREPRWREATAVGREHAIWRAEFFNRSVVRFYYVGAPMHYGLPETSLHPSGSRIVVPKRFGYVLAASRIPIAGQIVARDEKAGLILYRVDS